MFGIGTPELILILVLAFIIIGPKDLPRIARELGRAFRSFQRAADELKENITREMEHTPIEEDKKDKKE